MRKLPKPFFVLAPMDDVTDTAFRQTIASLAPPDMFFTEFVNVDGLQSPGREKLLPKLKYDKKERPIIAQIWGKNPENFYKTAKDLSDMGFDGIDINMGCPVKTVVKNGCCIALVNNRPLAQEIIKAVSEAAGPVPVSVKTRLGLNEVDYTWHEFLLGQNLDMLTIHGRTAKQMSKVPADWEAIGRVKKLKDKISPNTLIVGNGDITTREQGEKLAKKYQLDGIMAGRGVFDNPFLFSPNGSEQWAGFSKEQKIDLYKKHILLFDETYQNGERKLHTLNKFCKIYINGFDGAKELREDLMNVKTTKELLSLL